MHRLLTAVISFSFLICGNAFAQNAKYKRFGNYFEVSKVKYWVRGIHNVRGLGVIGRKTGADGPFPFSAARNGFEANGHLGTIPSFTATTATVSGKSLIKASANGSVDLVALAGIDVKNGAGDSKIAKNANYTVFVVSPNDWGEIYKKLQTVYNDGDKGLRERISNKDFRIIDSVVYASNMRVERTFSATGSLIDGGEKSNIKVSAKLQGSVDVESTFELTGRQIIAYSMRRLCWNEEVIVSAQIDLPIRIERC